MDIINSEAERAGKGRTFRIRAEVRHREPPGAVVQVDLFAALTLLLNRQIRPGTSKSGNVCEGSPGNPKVTVQGHALT